MITSKTLFKICLLLIGSSTLTAQWFSIEGYRVDGITTNSDINESVSFIEYSQETRGIDVVSLSNEYTGIERGTETISTRAIGGILRFHLPLTEKLTFNTGLGLAVQTISYMVNTTLSDSTLVSTTEVENLSLADFNEVLQPFPFICDDFTGFEIGVPFTREDPRTFYFLPRLEFPLNLQYSLIIDRLDLRTGVIFNAPIYKGITRTETHTIDTTLDEDNLVCALSEVENELSNTNLVPLSLSGSLGLDFKLKGRVRINLSMVKNLTPINNESNNRIELPNKYRPLSIQAGLSIDMIRTGNIEKRKTNYLLKKEQ